MTAPELLPCPFCGSKQDDHDFDTSWVRCLICGAEGGWNTPAQAVTAWNTRHPPPEVLALVEAGKLVLHWYEWGEGPDDLSLRKAVDKMRAAIDPFTGKES